MSRNRKRSGILAKAEEYDRRTKDVIEKKEGESMNRIIQGDALEKLRELPSESVDCCVTSPPYYQLRDYGCEGQIGLEETVEEYIDKLVAVFREVRRVLKKDGTLWINIADSYAGSGKARGQTTPFATVQAGNKGITLGNIGITPKCGCKAKDLLGVPWLLALALRDDGWYLRQDIIWQKPNPMPESVKDRCTKSHEYIFLLSKARKYYFDWKAIQEPCVGNNNIPPAGSKGTFRPNSRNRKSFRGGGAYTANASFNNSTDKQNETHGNAPNESGLRRKRSVWTVTTGGGKENHYATFPLRLVQPCVLAGSRRGGGDTRSVRRKRHNGRCGGGERAFVHRNRIEYRLCARGKRAVV